MRIKCEKKIHLNVHISNTHKICQSPSISTEIIIVTPNDGYREKDEDSITHIAGAEAV